MQKKLSKPLAITMGDPAGVGPEIIAGAWNAIKNLTGNNIVVYGHPVVLQRAAALRGVNEEIPCILCGGDSVLEVPPGTVDARCGETAYQAIIHAIDDAKSGKNAGVVTAPINKVALNLAGHHYPGHTEIFAERCGVKDFAMMLYISHGGNISSEYGLAVIHVTLHCAMKTIFEQITVESVLAKTKLVNHFMQQIIDHHSEGESRRPQIGICSLNPHAGENGLFGCEEVAVIQPAISLARESGILIDDPKPADTIMLDARAGKYDAVVAMFHDQGHIALKLLGMYRAVNVTVGLPIIRTSVAHGTAFDKAWQGIADTGSLIEAVKAALVLQDGV